MSLTVSTTVNLKNMLIFIPILRGSFKQKSGLSNRVTPFVISVMLKVYYQSSEHTYWSFAKMARYKKSSWHQSQLLSRRLTQLFSWAQQKQWIASLIWGLLEHEVPLSFNYIFLNICVWQQPFSHSFNNICWLGVGPQPQGDVIKLTDPLVFVM